MMTIEGLLSINTPVLMHVASKTNASFNVKDLVRAKKEAAWITDTLSYDLNNNGVEDANDLSVIRRNIVGLI